MKQYKEEWESELDDLETHIAVLLEQLDAAGIELPSLYKSIESQVPNVCETEVWKNMTHWAGSQVPEEANQSIRKADEYLQSCRPVRRKHGKLLEEGASGFLAGKIPVEDDGSVKCHEKSWNVFNELTKSQEYAEHTFGSSNWASVYLASTPQEAAALGLQFPGVDEVEEIAEVEGAVGDIKCVDEIELSEEQRRKYRKVAEEDDAKITKRLRRHLKERRTRHRYKGDFGLASPSNGCCELPPEKPKTDENGISVELAKRAREDDVELNHKRSKTVIIESDEDMETESKPASAPSENVSKIIDLDSPKLGDKVWPKAFKCTICTEMLNAPEVHRHPVLDVIVCGSCRFLVIERNRLEDPVSGGYCTWCVQSEQLQSCSSCKLLFCRNCLSKNFGEEGLSEAKVTGWQCCCCLPSQLEHLISECDKALSGVESSDPESDFADLSVIESNGPFSKGKMKKRIRRIMGDEELGEETKRKIAMEKARQEHLKSMQEQSASKSASKLKSNSIGTSFEAPTEVSLEYVEDGHIVNVAREEDEAPVRIPSSISAKLKPHQVSGIRFLWENVIQSVKKVKSGDKGFGCILAHNMGLGKTFQVITFLYTVMRCTQLGLRTVLIVTPVNVLHNWKKEFIKWRPTELKPLRVYMLEDVARANILYLLKKWQAKGGVLLIGYSAFRNLSLGRSARDKTVANEITNALQGGPDILVCDEAHIIKNRRADTTQALKQVKTQRRIALTGSPLQNNLMEYYCMVDFVREGYLGSSHEFRNRFQNPIENGQHTNSTSDDVKIMNQRSHILYEQLKGFVQRMDMNVVKNDLPPKKVFVVTVKLSQLQRKLYRRFLDVNGFSSSAASEKSFQRSCFFAKYQTLALIWNHPGLLQMAKEQKGNLRQEDVESFLMDESSSDDNIENYLPNGEKLRSRNDQPSKKTSDVVNEENNWWENLLDENTFKEADYSGKMVLLLDILSTCSELGDKALVFSQSLTTLDLVEFYLSKLKIKEKDGKYWKQGKDWYRIDGSTPSSERQNLVEKFNDPENVRVKCTLISTRAGSLGINLHAANRVILLDGSWNPTHDLQAIYRVWRYGQTKPVYAYRLMAHGTMEEKIYKRQVTKEGLAARVVDRQQVSRTISKEEMLHLFEFGDEELLEQSENGSAMNGHSKVETEKRATTNPSGTTEHLPLDRLMVNLLHDHSRWIASYHEHEALLQENEDERLTKEEQELAWLSYNKLLEVGPRKATHDPERKLNTVPTESNLLQPPKVTSRNRQLPQQPKVNLNNQKKCNNLSHLLTLRSQGTKPGCSTTCKECGQDISWETLNRDGRSR
ncbi:protein CHROMATIN REMODELING 20 isoform X2 [Oryza brachyantha]|nr:protein CHROMATIN REMODELING 20 isoform X2 [Oryza brachyantha]